MGGFGGGSVLGVYIALGEAARRSYTSACCRECAASSTRCRPSAEGTRVLLWGAGAVGWLYVGGHRDGEGTNESAQQPAAGGPYLQVTASRTRQRRVGPIDKPCAPTTAPLNGGTHFLLQAKLSLCVHPNTSPPPSRLY